MEHTGPTGPPATVRFRSQRVPNIHSRRRCSGGPHSWFCSSGFRSAAILYLGVRPEAPNLREMQPSQHMGVSLSLPGNWVVEDGESQIWDEFHGVTTVRISNLSILEVATVPAAIGQVGLEHSVNDYLDFMWECMETGRSREALKHNADGWAIHRSTP